MATLYFPHEVTEAQSICALRFKGYDYERAVGISDNEATGRSLSKLIEPVVKELIYTSHRMTILLPFSDFNAFYTSGEGST